MPPLYPLLAKEGKWGGQKFISIPQLIENLLKTLYFVQGMSNVEVKQLPGEK